MRNLLILISCAMVGLTGMLVAPIAKAGDYFLYMEAEDVLADALIEEGAGKAVQIRRIHAPQSLGSDAILTLRDIDYQDRTQSFTAVVEYQTDIPTTAPTLVKLRGKYDVMVDVPTIAAPLDRGEIINVTDVTWSHIPERRLSPTMVTDMDALVGKEVVRRINSDEPITVQDISEPSIVVKNTVVPMIYSVGNLELKTLGKAMEDGAIGQVIKLRNVDSGTTIRGMVMEEGYVLVNYTDQLLPSQMVRRSTTSNAG